MLTKLIWTLCFVNTIAAEVIMVVANQPNGKYNISCISKNVSNSALMVLGPNDAGINSKSVYIPEHRERVNLLQNSAQLQLQNSYQIPFEFIKDKRWEKFSTLFKNQVEVEMGGKKLLPFSVRTDSSLTLILPAVRIEITNLEKGQWHFLEANWAHKANISVKLDDEQYYITQDKQIRNMDKHIYYSLQERNSTIVHLSSINKKPFAAKFHKYSFLWWEQKFENVEIAKTRKAKGALCLAIHISACPNCEIILVVKGETSNMSSNGAPIKGLGRKWFEHRITFSSNLGENVTVTASGRESGNSGAFWALDVKARFCNEPEFSAVIEENVARQQLPIYKCVIPEKNVTASFITEPKSMLRSAFIKNPRCPEEHLGENCDLPFLTLQRGGIEMADTTICETLKNGKCECDQFGRYSCKRCSHQQACENKSSTCFSCLRPKMQLPDCVKPLCAEIRDLTANEGVNFLNLTVSCTAPPSQDVYIDLSLREEGKTHYLKSKRLQGHFEDTMDRLKPGTVYHVSARVHDKAHEICKTTVPIEKAFLTRCKGATRTQDFDIYPTDTAVRFGLKIRDEECCSLKVYKSEFHFKHHNDSISIDNLSPYTEYTIPISNEITKDRFTISFWTKSGRATPVRNVRFITDEKQIAVNWDKPRLMNGKSVTYTVTYTPLNCQNEEQKRLHLSERSVQLDGLRPSTVYEIRIVNVNEGDVEGEEYKHKILTPDDYLVGDVDVPEDVDVVDNVLTLKMSCRFHDSRYSVYVLDVSCSDSWCSGKEERTFPSGCLEYSMEDLIPFSNYSGTFTVHRNHLQRAYNKTVNFRSLAGPPNLDDVVVYSKGSNFVKFRLRLYPPNGILEQIWIVGNETAQHYDRPKKCEIWTQDHCVEMNGLLANKTYHFEISAKNQGTDFGNSKVTIAATVEEPSDAPIDLKCIPPFKVSWNYPNVTNGELKQFLLTVDQKEHRINVSKNLAYEWTSDKPFLQVTVQGIGYRYPGDSANTTCVPQKIASSKLVSNYADVSNCSSDFCYLVGTNELLNKRDGWDQKEIEGLVDSAKTTPSAFMLLNEEWTRGKREQEIRNFLSKWKSSVLVRVKRDDQSSSSSALATVISVALLIAASIISNFIG